jgi:allantoicase
MSMATPDPRPGQDEQARKFYETLVANDQVRDVGENEDTRKLPAHVTHVRYPDGRIKRIRFTGARRP